MGKTSLFSCYYGYNTQFDSFPFMLNIHVIINIDTEQSVQTEGEREDIYT